MAHPRFTFRCIHHGTATLNTRGLEDHVERDEDDNITSRRKQEATNIKARDCPYFLWLAYKQVGKRGSGKFGLVLGVKDDAHSHAMAVNPLVYSEHRKSLPVYHNAVELGRSLRSAYISYSAARRVLEQTGFPLDRKSYYNLRHRGLSAEKDDFAGLVVALENAGFEFECRMEEELDSEGKVTDTQLQQIWFAHSDQIRYTQRFAADWTLFIDGTFKTNARNLVLLVMAGITNCNQTFIAALSFARSEATVSFDFLFWSLKKRVFTSSIPLPRVIISDQTAGLTASMPTALSNATLQYCDWHAVENVMKRLADHGYKKDERKELRDLLWRFIKSHTHTELAESRLKLHSKLKDSEIEYLKSYWGPRETRFLRIYTRTYPNLGAHSNQRSESIHPVTTQILNKNLSMEEATKRLGETIKAKFRELAEAEAIAGSKLPRLIDLQAFKWLANTVTYQAIDRVAPEWEATKKGCQDGSLQALLEPCTHCELLVRYGLPCRHHLRQVCLDGAPIPRSLLHPRWWIHGEPIKINNWIPLYEVHTLPLSPPRNAASNVYLSPTRNEITGLGLQVIQARENLTGYARQRYETAATQAQRGLVEFAQELEEEDLHVRMPDAVKTSSWKRKFKAHGKAKRRLLTGAEAAERDANTRERETGGDTGGPLRKREASESPRRRYTSPAGSVSSVGEEEEEAEAEEEEEDPFVPPPSTAPPALTISRAERKRAPTMKALEAEAAPKRGNRQSRGRGRGDRRFK